MRDHPSPALELKQSFSESDSKDCICSVRPYNFSNKSTTFQMFIVGQIGVLPMPEVKDL